MNKTLKNLFIYHQPNFIVPNLKEINLLHTLATPNPFPPPSPPQFSSQIPAPVPTWFIHHLPSLSCSFISAFTSLPLSLILSSPPTPSIPPHLDLTCQHLLLPPLYPHPSPLYIGHLPFTLLASMQGPDPKRRLSLSRHRWCLT